jgi:HEAT repeat protein
MRSSNADERLRGIERAAATHTPEAFSLLERATKAGLSGAALDPRMPPDGTARSDPRALLAAVQGLASWDTERSRAALLAVVGAPADFVGTRAPAPESTDPAADEAEGAERVKLAREEAAVALAASGGELTLEALVAIARSGGAGQAAALEALAIHPPAPPLALGGVVLTTAPLIALAARIADLRSLDPILGAVHASDPTLRAAVILALGSAGDTRALEIARTASHDPDPRVRLAAGEALVRLEAPDAATTVEALIADDATVLEALALARDAQGEGVTKAAAARAVASADGDVRVASIDALARQASPTAVEALVAFLADARLQSDAASALARSPSPAALGALDAIAGKLSVGATSEGDRTGALRRLVGRAYFVRRFLRGDRNPRLDALLESLAASADPRDRSVGVQALVTFGERALEGALRDADPRVRRASALGAVGAMSVLQAWDSRTGAALLARAAIESDEPTRRVLAVGLSDGDADEAVPSSKLLERAGAGGPDAPLATFALARRRDDRLTQRVDELLGSHDPLVRAHAARGLGDNPAPDAAGRLVRACAWEGDASVRRAIVRALARRAAGAADASMAVRGLWALAARLDPDAETRAIATAALAGSFRSVDRAGGIREIAWVRLVPADGATMPRDETARIEQNDALAIPIAFDDEGYALVPGVLPGDALLRLAPRLPAYTAPAP